MFSDVKQVRWTTLGLFVALHSAFKFVFFSDAFARQAYTIRLATAGLLTETFLTYLLELVVLVGGVALLGSRLRPGDLGLSRSGLLNAALLGLLLWGLVQLTILLVEQVETGEPTLHPALHYPPAAVLGRAMEALFGSALFEEIMYRGFLLPQLYLKLGQQANMRADRQLVVAVLATQLYFGLNHVPAGLAMHLPPLLLLGYVVQVTLVGVLLAALFLRTANLFLAVGVHALLNHPVPLFASRLDPSLIVLILTSTLLILWPLLARAFDEVFTMRPALASWRYAYKAA